MKKKSVLIWVLWMTALMAGQSLWATEHTVTYTITGMSDYGTNGAGSQLTFTPNNSGFGTSTGTKVATIQNLQSTTGFSVELDDGVTFTLSLKSGSSMSFIHDSNSAHYGILLNYNGDQNVRFNVRCSNYYITHVKLAQMGGTTLFGTGTPTPLSNASLDVDVDIDKSTYENSHYNAYVTANTNFGQLTVTLSDTPRPYTLTYADAVDGVKYVTNTNPTTYDVTTPDFQITAPTRTGYTFEGFYNNQGFTGNPVTLPLTITRGQAANMKNRTFYAKWSVIPWEGNGSENTPYLIQYPSQLELLAESVNAGNDYEGTFFQLDADLPFSTTGLGDNESNFTAIGTDSHPFKGTFDGNNKVVSGIRIRGGNTGNQGLFGHVGAGGTVKNTLLDNVVIAGQTNAGVVVGHNEGTLSVNYYHACSVNNQTTNVGTGAGDVSGARGVYAVQLGNQVCVEGESVVIGSSTCFAANTIVTVTRGDLPGYTSYFWVSGDTISGDITSPATFTMPNYDVVVTLLGDYRTEYVEAWHAGPSHNGTSAEKPYLITSPAGLQLLSSETNSGNSFLDRYFKLGSDINMSGVFNFTPIGDGNNFHCFRGYFDGDNHTISGLTADDLYESAGLFGHIIDSNISNLTLLGARITGRNHVGGIVGLIENTGNNISSLVNCHVFSSVITARISSALVGAIVGDMSTDVVFDGNTYHSTLVNYYRAFNIGTGEGDIDGISLDTTQLFVTCFIDSSNLATLTAAYRNPANYVAHDGTVPNLSNLTATIIGNVTLPAGSILEAQRVRATSGNTLTLEDGAQFIVYEPCTTNFIYLQKHISPFTSDGNGWNMITLGFTMGINLRTMVSGLVPTGASDVYDCFMIAQDGNSWENDKTHMEDSHLIIGPDNVRLYASSVETVVQNNSPQTPHCATEKGEKVNMDRNRWTMVGNPYPFNAYVDRPYYRMNQDGSAFELVLNYWEEPLSVGQGVLIKSRSHVVYASDSVYFTLNPPAQGNIIPADTSGIMAKLPDQHGLGADSRFMYLLKNVDNNVDLIHESAGKARDFCLKERTLYKDGLWNTLCLPFAVDSQYLAKGKYAGADIRTLSSSTFEDGTLTMNFTPVTSIEAGKPYIIRWQVNPYIRYDGRSNENTCSDIAVPDFADVTVPANYADDTVTTDWVDFIGVTSPKYMAPYDTTKLILAVKDTAIAINYLWYPANSPCNLFSCRAYFQLKNGLSVSRDGGAFGDPTKWTAAPLMRIVMNIDGESITTDLIHGRDDSHGSAYQQGSSNAVKFFLNGHLYIRKDGVLYDVMGKRIE